MSINRVNVVVTMTANVLKVELVRDLLLFVCFLFFPKQPEG